MKLYYTGEGAACTVYIPAGSVSVTIQLRKEGLEYPPGVAALLLDGYKHLVSKDAARADIAPQTGKPKGGEN